MQPIKDYNAASSFNVGIAVDLGVTAAIVYNELAFWSKFGKRADKFIYISYEDMMNRLPFLSKFQLSAAYKALAAEDWIEHKIMRANGSPTNHFRLLRNLTIHSKETSLSESKETSLSITVDKHTVKNKQKREPLSTQVVELAATKTWGEGRVPSELVDAMLMMTADRFERKKDMTANAVGLAYKKLNGMYPFDSKSQVACIEQSVANGWLGLFEIKENGNYQSKQSNGVAKI